MSETETRASGEGLPPDVPSTVAGNTRQRRRDARQRQQQHRTCHATSPAFPTMDLRARMVAMDLRMLADRTGREHKKALGTGTPADHSGEQQRRGEEGEARRTRFVANVFTQNRFQLIDLDGEVSNSNSAEEAKAISGNHNPTLDASPLIGFLPPHGSQATGPIHFTTTPQVSREHQDTENTSTGPSLDWYTVTGGKYIKQNSPQQPSGMSAGSSSPSFPAKRKPRLQPLPVSNYGVVFHPRGLNFAEVSPVLLSLAVQLTTKALIVISKAVYELRSYQTPPRDSVRGVTHGIPPEADSDYLMEMICAHDATLI
ncbi:hypothetical protein HPB47_011042 [Ixodes persulcatus]|uniref:Uncharacterized protein n=1 Tax=Ixodes persulcatus TaxID=34615 RepID=A0AC60NXH6_IXOPE|nr:hypothetical protein HPB47_011042 [Ixodes persulcatus]